MILSAMPNRPINPNDPPNPPDITVESVFGAEVGNPPILPLEENEPADGHPEPPDGALIDEVVPRPTPPSTEE
jgi:hypothetical protein